MAKVESFDISTGADLNEVANAVNQSRKEIGTRFDFKNVVAEIDYDHGSTVLGIHTADDYKLEAIWQVLTQRLIARGVPLKNFRRGKPVEAARGTIRQQIDIVQGIDSDLARKITKFIRDANFKRVQTQVQGDAIRVSAPQRDELQGVITALKAEDWGIELSFGNYR